LEEGFQQFGNDLNKLQQFVEINGTAFSKILKKWDKTSKSKTKELYLSRAVEVQPFFNKTVISELSDQATTSLQDLGAWSEGDQILFERQAEHVVSTHLGTDEGDADTLLLEAVIAGNLDNLKDLLLRLKTASDPDGARNAMLTERITRTFLGAIHEAPEPSLQILLDTGLVDALSEDDINERNCLHQATIYGNTFVLQVGLQKNVAVDRTDVYGRVPLHYACMHGRLDMMEALLDANIKTIDLIDHDNFTPIIHAIIHGHLECVAMLLARSARIDPLKENDHIPLNLACEHGSIEITELLLKHGAKIMADAEGLYPQHLVARSGQTPQLLLLLQSYGADLNQLDKLYAWTPLFHAASEGNVPCMKTLLDVGVRVDILDEKDLSAMYYAAWEGHLECMKLLSSIRQNPTLSSNLSSPSGLKPRSLLGSSAPLPMSIDADGIPDLLLPPPIIPLRRYGHNFLDTKTFIQISFDDLNGEPPMVFFHDSKYPAARLTISSKLSDLIPKNILLPFQEDTRLVSFQIEDLDSFAVDFDIFPTYGAKVIAKTVALPNTFRAISSSSGRCCLPLFDPRLRAIGQISFNFQVIKPFAGKPLEITDFDTYWKATSQFDHHPNAMITGSSLSGSYVQLFVQCTSDNVPVLYPQWIFEYYSIPLPISRLTYQEYLAIGAKEDLSFMSTGEDQELMMSAIHEYLNSQALSLEDALKLLPAGTNVNIQMLYPSAEEERTFHLGPTLNINDCVDAVLSVVFDHTRQLREHTPDKMPSIVFSSYNPTVCTALNWKQPNFPVFLCNDLGREEDLERGGRKDLYEGTKNARNDSRSPTYGEISGRTTVSVKEAVRIAKDNNLMGLICCGRLLVRYFLPYNFSLDVGCANIKQDMVPALIDAVKSQGLVLVTDRSTCAPAQSDPRNPFPRLPEGIDGELKGNGVLKFIESIEM
jgi:CDK inhibitor PHO81